MTETVREVLKRYQSFYEVTPYYVFVDERPIAAKPTTKTVKAGFDIDVYSEKVPDQAHPSTEYARVYEALQKMTEAIAHDTTDSCFVDVVPFNSTVYLDPKQHFQGKTLLRISVRHGRGLQQAASTPEERAVKTLLGLLDQLGVSSSKSS